MPGTLEKSGKGSVNSGGRRVEALLSAMQYVARRRRALWSFVRISAFTASEQRRQSLLVERSHE